jgi:hypothetical protein
LVEATVNPNFLRTVPDRKPRTECGNQPVAFRYGRYFLTHFGSRRMSAADGVHRPSRPVQGTGLMGRTSRNSQCHRPLAAHLLSEFLT